MEVVLKDMGFAVVTASDGNEARHQLEDAKDRQLSLLITDIDMPGCSGIELARYARESNGEIKIIFTSGAPQPDLVRSIAEDQSTRFLRKPFEREQLRNQFQQLGISYNKSR
jgi:CheY-like chemotaxis protein